MQVSACHRFAKISPRKARLVVDLVRGEPVNEALEILRMTRKRASVFVEKVVRSAIAAAGENHDADAEDLMVEKIWVDSGPTRRTFWARPRGMWAPKLHRTSHIHVVLSDEEEVEVDQEAGGEE